MPRNIEIEARIDDLERLERRVQEIATAGPEYLKQTDTFFECTEGRLKLREFADGAAELIHYHRANQVQPTESEYSICAVPDAPALKTLLDNALGSIGTVCKQRTLYLCGQTRIHLDKVTNLREFMELEVVLSPNQSPAQGQRIARRLMQSLCITEAALIDVAYVDLLVEPHSRLQ